VIAYEWREALGGWEGALRQSSDQPLTEKEGAYQEVVKADAPADAQQIAGLLTHWEQSLIEIGFLDPQAPKKLMPRLQQLFNRAALTPEEVHILRGVARQMTRHRAEKG